MSLSDAFVGEIEYEARSTRQLLERLPEDRLDYKPHEKSMPLARLAGHTAEIPGWAALVATQSDLDVGGDYKPNLPTSRAEVLDTFDKGVAAFKQAVTGKSDADLAEIWRLRKGERVLLEMPRTVALRSFVLSHMIHHRGQLTVYLRLLDVPLPSIYGPSADDNAGF